MPDIFTETVINLDAFACLPLFMYLFVPDPIPNPLETLAPSAVIAVDLAAQITSTMKVNPTAAQPIERLATLGIKVFFETEGKRVDIKTTKLWPRTHQSA